VLEPNTRFVGSVWDIALSEDPEQKYLYVADGPTTRFTSCWRKSGQELDPSPAGPKRWRIPLGARDRNRFARQPVQRRVDTGKRVQKLTRQR